MRRGMFNTPFLKVSGGVLLTVLLAVSLASGEGFRYKEIDIRWDNTVKYSTGVRVAGPDHNLATANTDDAINNFPRGSFFTNRADLLSEFDIKSKNYAIRVSGAGWYDTIYATSNNNTSATSNNFSVASYHFTKATREYSARRFELLDAFAFARKGFGDDKEVSLRFGRQTVNWGGGLMMPSNELSFGQAPIDGNKAAIAPNTSTKELLMPVGQVSVHFKPMMQLSIDGYWQFEARKSNNPAAGTYFSPSDFPDIGGERLLAGGGTAFFRGQDVKAKNGGNFGGAVYYKLKRPEWLMGFYFTQHNARSGYTYLRPGATACPFPLPHPACPSGMLVFNPSVVDLSRGQIGEFVYVYPENIKTGGASLTTNWGGANINAEAFMRWNMPLVSNTLIDASTTGDNHGNPLYAIGNTFHANINYIYLSPKQGPFDSVSYVWQVGYNHLMKITRNAAAYDRRRSTDAFAFAVSLTPTKYRVVNYLDVSFPVTVSYSPKAKAAMDSGFNSGVNRGGNWSVGVNPTYKVVWRGSVKYVHYWGSDNLAKPGVQIFRGKDFVTLSIQRTF